MAKGSVEYEHDQHHTLELGTKHVYSNLLLKKQASELQYHLIFYLHDLELLNLMLQCSGLKRIPNERDTKPQCLLTELYLL